MEFSINEESTFLLKMPGTTPSSDSVCLISSSLTSMFPLTFMVKICKESTYIIKKKDSTPTKMPLLFLYFLKIKGSPFFSLIFIFMKDFFTIFLKVLYSEAIQLAEKVSSSFLISHKLIPYLAVKFMNLSGNEPLAVKTTYPKRNLIINSTDDSSFKL